MSEEGRANNIGIAGSSQRSDCVDRCKATSSQCRHDAGGLVIACDVGARTSLRQTCAQQSPVVQWPHRWRCAVFFLQLSLLIARSKSHFLDGWHSSSWRVSLSFLSSLQPVRCCFASPLFVSFLYCLLRCHDVFKHSNTMRNGCNCLHETFRK